MGLQIRITAIVHSLLLSNYALVGIPENRAGYSLALKSLYFEDIITYTRRRLGKSVKNLDDKFLNPYKNGIFYKMPLANGAVEKSDRQERTRRGLL